jgi:hypothetical protein
MGILNNSEIFASNQAQVAFWFQAFSSQLFSVSAAMEEESVPLVTAANMLHMGYGATLNAVLRGELRGWQDERRRWRVRKADVIRTQTREFAGNPEEATEPPT